MRVYFKFHDGLTGYKPVPCLHRNIRYNFGLVFFVGWFVIVGVRSIWVLQPIVQPSIASFFGPNTVCQNCFHVLVHLPLCVFPSVHC